jgi:hypothetical protein
MVRAGLSVSLFHRRLGQRSFSPKRAVPSPTRANVTGRGPEPLSGARVGAPAGVPPSVSQGANAAESRVGSTFTVG